MSSEPIQLDPAQVTSRIELRYQQIIAQLVRENAHLETYVAQLQQQLQQPQPDAWGDPTEGTT